MFLDDCVRAWCIDDVEIVEKADGQITLNQVPRNFDGPVFWSMTEDANLVCCREHINLCEFVAEKRVEQRGLAGFHFSYDDEKQRLTDIRQ